MNIFYRGGILGRIRDKKFETFALCYSQSPPPADFTPPLKPKAWEISRNCPEASTKLYFHEFHLRTEPPFSLQHLNNLFIPAEYSYSWTLAQKSQGYSHRI